jgi:hypothetical protein
MGFYRGPNVVTNGLVLSLDAANTKSYPGSGTAWRDLSGNGNNGTLVNGPTFSSANGGSIVLDGTNDYVNCGNILNYTSQNFTFNCWVFINSLTTNLVNQGPVLFFKGLFNTNGYYTQISQTGTISFVTNNSGVNLVTNSNNGVISAGNIYNVSITRNGNSVRTYVNGIDLTSIPANHSDPTTSNSSFTIGSYNLTQIVANIRIFSFSNYNRALSAAEVLQNYNATQARFNLT